MELLKKTVPWMLGALLVAGCVTPQKKTVIDRGAPPFDSSKPAYPTTSTPTTSQNQAEQQAIVENTIEQSGAGKSAAQPAQVTLPSMKYVNDRIFEYGRKLERWRKMDAQSAALELDQQDSETMVNCFMGLKNVHDGYKQLRSDMLAKEQGSSIQIDGANVVELQKSDISFLESICGQLFAPESDELVNWANREKETGLPQLEALIERYSESKEYEEVVQVWQKIPVQQQARVHLRTKILYGNALRFLHQEEKAAEIYQQIVDEMASSKEQRTDLLSLRKMLADLYTAAGNYSAAQQQYRNISKDYRDLGSIEEWSTLQLNILERSGGSGPELKKYSALLRDYLGFVPERDGYKVVWSADKFLKDYPYSIVASNAEIMKADAQSRAQTWFNSYITEVDRLAADKKFINAIEKLESIPTDLISQQQKEQVKAKNEDLVMAEAVARETRKIEQIQNLQSRWNEGMVKVSEGRYTEAIDIFRTLLPTEYKSKAEDKINELTLLAAKTDRRAAADLYIRYTKTSDPMLQRRLLTESRKLLIDILNKYPDVNIADKVKGNIRRVEQEMNNLDPSLLPAIQEAERIQEMGSGSLQQDDDMVFNSAPQSPSSEENKVLDIKISQ